jgi:iron complex outermembrane receptor protein
MDNLCKKLMLGGSMAAMFAAMSAGAQAQEQQAENVENVTVSASRINIQGYEAPVPVTVIGAATLERDAEVDIGDSIRQLPAVGNSDSPRNGSHSGNSSQGDAGIDTVDLRGLGVIRTLVLFDGQRVVTSNPNSGGPPAIGGVDLSTLPTSIIERVDVVTGGASAQWGSDAVAGVVNLIINKTFTGVKANVFVSDNKYNDNKSIKGELTVGSDFLGGRLHTEFAANYTMSPDTAYGWTRPWYNNTNRALYSCAVVNGGPAHALCHTPAGVYDNSHTNGGLITASVAGSAANVAAIQALGGQFAGAGTGTLASSNALRGIQFVGPAAQQVPFNFGINNITPGSNAAGSNCYACSSNFNTAVANAPIDSVPYHQLNLFSYTSFRLTPDITASLMLNYGWNAENNQANDGRIQQVNVKVDNAFIPAALQQQMIAQGIPSFSLGTEAIQNLQSATQVSMKNLGLAMAQNYVQNYRQLMRGVFTLTGDYKLFGEDWSWNAYAQNSSVRERQLNPYNTNGVNVGLAEDAVVVQAAGPDSLGGGNAVLAAQVRAALTANHVAVPTVGSIACRSALTATSWGTFTNSAGFQQTLPGGQQPGCVPLNLFGDGNVSQAALNYIAPGRQDRSVMDQGLFLMSQSVFSVSTQGTLPWGLAAGKPAVSFGFEDRLEQQRNTRDPLELGASGTFESGNFSEFSGEYNVQEGFLEVNVPVLKDSFVDSLNVDAAGRMTSYSTSGLVETWKVGAESQVNEDIKLRTSLSNDIRAPGVGELFLGPPLISTQNLSYPPGGPSYNVHQIQAGNPQLIPEQAETVSGGIVLTPHWIENLSMSFDWYSITLHNGIFSFSSNQIFSGCAVQHQANFCSLVFFAKGWPGNSSTNVASEVDGNGVVNPALLKGNTYTADGEGAFNAYYQGPLNANRETDSGLDFQMDYSHELLAGTMDWHILGNYTDEKTRTSAGVTVDGAGAVSNDSTLNPLSGFTAPKFRSTITSTYTEGPWSLTAQARIISSARLTNDLTQNQSIYTSIDDNSVPAVIYGDFRGSYRWNDHIQLYGAIDNAFNAPPPNLGSIGGGGTSCVLYDCIGRAYRIGVRFDD